jgi:diguanylate cyclase (GGDEF)-like protein
MLETTLRGLAEKLIPVEFDRLRLEVREEVSRKSMELAKRGLIHSGAAVGSTHTICVQQVEKRVEAVWRILLRVMARIGVSFSDVLASDLKAFLDYHAPVSLWELPGFYTQMGGKELYEKQFGSALLEAREQVLRRLHAEIDLYVEGLRAKALQAAAVVVAKERDQKFGILLSPNQATIDFDAWKAHFGSGGASIAILYLDIDYFKSFNTRYTETVVDQTILPDVLRLLASLVDQRGGCYQQGGDEFVMILPNHEKTESAAFAEKVRSLIASQQFRVGDKTETLTISGGVALWPEHGGTYDAVLLKANQAKQTAKQARNTIVLHQ